jgi:integrase/recombinase XerD
MNSLRQALDEYLEMRRAMGFKMIESGYMLPKLIHFLEARQLTFITSELAVHWATQSNKCQPAQWARRLRQVRVFARYRKAVDARTEVPALKLLPYPTQRATPLHLYR